MTLEAKLKAEIARWRKRQAFALERGYERAAEKNAAKASYHAGLLESLKSGADPSDIEFNFDPQAQLNHRQRQLEIAIRKSLDRYITATDGYFELSVWSRSVHVANFDSFTVNANVKFTFENLKDAIRAARFAQTNVTDFNFAEINAAHFRGYRGYFLNELGEQSFNDDVRTALDELAAGDLSIHPLSEFDKLKCHAADIAKVVGTANAEWYFLAGLYNLSHRQEG